jgi:hypothetical protein
MHFGICSMHRQCDSNQSGTPMYSAMGSKASEPNLGDLPVVLCTSCVTCIADADRTLPDANSVYSTRQVRRVHDESARTTQHLRGR